MKVTHVHVLLKQSWKSRIKYPNYASFLCPSQESILFGITCFWLKQVFEISDEGSLPKITLSDAS